MSFLQEYGRLYAVSNQGSHKEPDVQKGIDTMIFTRSFGALRARQSSFPTLTAIDERTTETAEAQAGPNGAVVAHTEDKGRHRQHAA